MKSKNPLQFRQLNVQFRQLKASHRGSKQQ